MPNCQWFGTRADHARLLDTIFAMDEVEVFELHSRDGESIRIFPDTPAVLAAFDGPFSSGRPRDTLLLNLHVRAASDTAHVQHVARPPRDGRPATWFERTGADGFVQFYLSLPGQTGLSPSTTNTPSPARMGAKDGIASGPKGIVDVGAAHRWSAKLNRRIAKQATARLGNFYVMPGAVDLWQGGVALSAMTVATHAQHFRPL